MIHTDCTSIDREFCRSMLPRVSRSFAVSIEALPGELRDAVRVAYLLCRIVDTIEDEVRITPLERWQLFDGFDAAVTRGGGCVLDFECLCRQLQIGSGSADGELCASASAVFRCLAALTPAASASIRPHVLEMSAGMRGFMARGDALGRLRLHDVPELERYCYYVAGTVGKMLTGLFEEAVPGFTPSERRAAWRAAVSFGIGLQLVNIVKDVAADFGRRVCFLPESLALEHGVELDDLLSPDQRPAALKVVRALCQRARVHLEQACEYTSLWPLPGGEPIRLFCAVPLMLAFETLREVERSPDTLCLDRVPKVSRSIGIQVFANAQVAVGDDRRLGELFTPYMVA